MNSNEQQANREFKGVFIPVQILQNPNLKGDEKITLALIQHYTINGEKHACYLTNERIAEITGINYYKLRDRVKPKLVKLGYITTNGGIKSMSTKQQNHDTNSVDGIQQDNSKNTIQIDNSKTTIQIESVEDNSKTTIEEQQNHDTPNSKTTIQRNIKKEEKEIYILPTITKRDCHQSDPDPVNNITSDLGIYVDDNTPDVPEWMNELPVTEPFVQYTDDIQGEAMEQTNELSQADERLNDPDEPQETETSLNAALSDERNSGGTTTHRQGESLPNGEKKAETGAMDNNNPNKRNENMTIQERKQKQQELNQKWDNFKSQVNTMTQSDAETYFKRFLTKVGEYYTGTHIDTTQERYTREFNGLKPLMRHDWNAEKAKQIVQNAVNDYWEEERIERTLKNAFGQPVNRGWLESAFAEAKIKRDAERNTYKPDGDLPF